MYKSIRALDFLLAVFMFFSLSPVFLITYFLCYFDTGSAIFSQLRVGLNKKPFTLYKFRSMYLESPELPTHFSSVNSVTKIGSFLRRTKIDELPQLINIINGDMSFVGPRPCLLTQKKLIMARDAYNIYSFKPGLTGFAQLRGIDMSQPLLLAKIDKITIESLNLSTYFKLIFLTFLGQGQGDRVFRND